LRSPSKAIRDLFPVGLLSELLRLGGLNTGSSPSSRVSSDPLLWSRHSVGRSALSSRNSSARSFFLLFFIIKRVWFSSAISLKDLSPVLYKLQSSVASSVFPSRHFRRRRDESCRVSLPVRPAAPVTREAMCFPCLAFSVLASPFVHVSTFFLWGSFRRKIFLRLLISRSAADAGPPRPLSLGSSRRSLVPLEPSHTHLDQLP